MMKRALRIVLVTCVLATLALPASGQGHIRRAMQRAREQQEAYARRQVNNSTGRSPGGSGWLPYNVVDGDTTYFDTLDPIWVFGHGRGNEKNWRDYYKLVYRFAKVYPYAQAAGRLQAIVDSTIQAGNFSRMKKDRYISEVQSRLFSDFEGALHSMTISQGALLLKLIDRETGKSSYSIIKDYKNGLAARFWQGIARMFDNDLHSQYDPEGADKDIEELVQIWNEGHFRDLYWSIFWEEPPVVQVPDYYR